jgi:hypothetical protein
MRGNNWVVLAIDGESPISKEIFILLALLSYYNTVYPTYIMKLQSLHWGDSP